MVFEVRYFHARVLDEIAAWPADVLVGQRVVVLHAFVKKDRQTPERELKLARKRLKELQHG
jgi:hypothetical protein